MQNPSQKAVSPLTTLDGNTLMSHEYDPLQFSIEKILPHGVFILAGSGKIGKSWLSLDMCTAVATGGMLWEFSAEQGEVLYLALEDTYPRLQSRLTLIQEEKVDIARLHLATASLGIGDGLLEQIHNFLTAHPDTKLIVIDTLERIRNVDFDKSMYSCDYRASRDYECLQAYPVACPSHQKNVRPRPTEYAIRQYRLSGGCGRCFCPRKRQAYRQ